MTNRYTLVIIILFLISITGLTAWVYQIQNGLILTNMRNSFPWGLYIVMWAFYVGTAAGGLVVSSAVYLFGAKQLKPIAKIASLTAFIFSAAALIMITPDIGRPDRLLNMLIYPNFDSILPWDFIVLSVYSIVSAIYTYIQFRPDIAAHGIKIPFKGTILKKNINKDGIATIQTSSDKYSRYLAPIALPLALLIHTVTAWVLATQIARAWWFGGLLAPTFIAAALATGPAVVILASIIALGYKKEHEKAYKLLAKISAVSTLGLLFLYYNDFVVRLWWNQGKEFEALQILVNDVLPLHIFEITFMLLAAFIFVTRSNSKSGLIVGSIFINLGIVAHRYLLLGPAYNLIPLKVPFTANGVVSDWSYPIAIGEIRGSILNPEPVFTTYWNYFPSIFEIVIAAAIFALIGLAFIALIRILPVNKSEK